MATDLTPGPDESPAGEQPERLDLRSMDVTEEKRQDLLRLFPEARTEGGKIDFERLQLALGEMVDAGRERYGMTWPVKADCFKTIQTPSLGTLLPSREESVNFDTTENLISYQLVLDFFAGAGSIADITPERVVCLDAGFAGNDQLKANAVQIFKTLHRPGDDLRASSDVTVFRTV